MANLSIEVVDGAGVTRYVRPVDAREIIAQQGGEQPAALPASNKDTAKAVSSAPKADSGGAGTGYAKMKKADLIALAAEKGFDLTPDDVTVAQIIALLEEAD